MARPTQSQDTKSDDPPRADRHAVAAALREIAALLAAEGTNRFRARAYERGARAVEILTADVAVLASSGRLTEVPGIGSTLAATITELITTGRARVLDRLRQKLPPGAAALSPVLSLARIRAVHDALGITTLEELRAACEAGRVRGVPGFGEKTERRLLERIAALAEAGDGTLLPAALAQADAVVSHLRAHPAVERVEIAGALRRRVESIAALDLVVAATDAPAVLAHAGSLPAAIAVDAAAPDRVVVRRIGALDVGVRVVTADRFAAAWVEVTGSDAHVAKLAARAAAPERARDPSGDLTSEAGIYRAFGLAFVPPELREDEGEIEAAAAGELPDAFVRLEDVRGAVHCHTVYSDGRDTIEAMAHAAEALGLDYLTITDHSATATYAGGLDVDRLRRQWDEIARVQERVRVRLLRGTESDILRDGALDFPDTVLERLDVVIASIHNRHGLTAGEMTDRLVRALSAPTVQDLGPPARPVRAHAPAVRLRHGCRARRRRALARSDRGERRSASPGSGARWIRAARRRGIRFVISSDAHSVEGLRNVRFGVDMARRGWLERADVLNTCDADAFAAAVRPRA